MEKYLIKITPDGLFGQVENQHPKMILDTDRDDRLVETIINPEWVDFNTANPPYPLTEPGEPGKVVDAVLGHYHQTLDEPRQWKHFDIDNLMDLNIENGFINCSGMMHPVQQMWEVISNKEEMPEKEYPNPILKNDLLKLVDDFWPIKTKEDAWEMCFDAYYIHPKNNRIYHEEQPIAEQSIEEAANIHSDLGEYDTSLISIRKRSFIARTNHILNAKGLVSKDKVCEIIEKLFTDHVGFSQYSRDYLINQIGEL